MDYKKTTWIDDDTPVDAEHLNNIEDGIEKISDTALTGVDVNGDPAEVIDHRANIDAATPEDINRVETTATEALNKATAVEDTAIQGVTVNGTAAEVVDHIAQISVSGGGVFGTVDEEQTITIRGSGVFGFFMIESELYAVAMNSQDAEFTEMPGVEIIQASNGVFEVRFIIEVRYIIFGATSITVED